MHFTNKQYQYLSCEIVLARPIIWIIIPRRNIISVHIALHLRTRAGGRPMLLHRLWENFHRNVNLNFTWEISLRRSHINVPTVAIRSYLTHKKGCVGIRSNYPFCLRNTSKWRSTGKWYCISYLLRIYLTQDRGLKVIWLITWTRV